MQTVTVLFLCILGQMGKCSTRGASHDKSFQISGETAASQPSTPLLVRDSYKNAGIPSEYLAPRPKDNTVRLITPDKDWSVKLDGQIRDHFIPLVHGTIEDLHRHIARGGNFEYQWESYRRGKAVVESKRGNSQIKTGGDSREQDPLRSLFKEDTVYTSLETGRSGMRIKKDEDKSAIWNYSSRAQTQNKSDQKQGVTASFEHGNSDLSHSRLAVVADLVTNFTTTPNFKHSKEKALVTDNRHKRVNSTVVLSPPTEDYRKQRSRNDLSKTNQNRDNQVTNAEENAAKKDGNAKITWTSSINLVNGYYPTNRTRNVFGIAEAAEEKVEVPYVKDLIVREPHFEIDSDKTLVLSNADGHLTGGDPRTASEEATKKLMTIDHLSASDSTTTLNHFTIGSSDRPEGGTKEVKAAKTDAAKSSNDGSVNNTQPYLVIKIGSGFLNHQENGSSSNNRSTGETTEENESIVRNEVLETEQTTAEGTKEKDLVTTEGSTPVMRFPTAYYSVHPEEIVDTILIPTREAEDTKEKPLFTTDNRRKANSSSELKFPTVDNLNHQEEILVDTNKTTAVEAGGAGQKHSVTTDKHMKTNSASVSSVWKSSNVGDSIHSEETTTTEDTVTTDDHMNRNSATVLNFPSADYPNRFILKMKQLQEEKTKVNVPNQEFLMYNVFNKPQRKQSVHGTIPEHEKHSADKLFENSTVGYPIWVIGPEKPFQANISSKKDLLLPPNKADYVLISIPTTIQRPVIYLPNEYKRSLSEEAKWKTEVTSPSHLPGSNRGMKTSFLNAGTPEMQSPNGLVLTQGKSTTVKLGDQTPGINLQHYTIYKHQKFTDPRTVAGTGPYFRFGGNVYNKVVRGNSGSGNQHQNKPDKVAQGGSPERGSANLNGPITSARSRAFSPQFGKVYASSGGTVQFRQPTQYPRKNFLRHFRLSLPMVEGRRSKQPFYFRN